MTPRPATWNAFRPTPKKLNYRSTPQENDSSPNGDWQGLVGEMPSIRATLLGETVARLHAGLIDHKNPDFQPEDFSLHYQRSLYSAWQSQVRATFQKLKKLEEPLPGLEELLDHRKELLGSLRKIYDHKIYTKKVRIHGDLHLEKVLFTGRSFVFFDFEGDRIRSYSELRLKKSPVRDLASLICSLYYTATAPLCTETGMVSFHDSNWLPWAEAWFDRMAGAFLSGYLPQARRAGLVPENTDDFHLLLRVFLLERHLYELGFEIERGRGWEPVPLRGLWRMMEGNQDASYFI